MWDFENTLINLSFMRKYSSAAGRDFRDVQLSRILSPATTCLLKPWICGPPLGNSMTKNIEI